MSMLNRSNLEPYLKVKLGTGDGYVAWTEVHHQLGCLNLVRQYTWLLMGGYPEDRIPSELRWLPDANRDHVDYCIETIRQSLMCQGDMTPMLVTKERHEASGWRMDLAAHHKCRNFTKLQEWAKVHRLEDQETVSE
ncbi:hypothetical protein MMC25_006226 [Agyrium rufum]|nr:hypothetical protein [Agyrium rufum]